MSNIDRIDLIDLYRKLFLTRHYDETLRKLAEGDVWNFYHDIIGEEAVPVGVFTNLRARELLRIHGCFRSDFSFMMQ